VQAPRHGKTTNISNTYKVGLTTPTRQDAPLPGKNFPVGVAAQAGPPAAAGAKFRATPLMQ
jgi:hypothetical protein